MSERLERYDARVIEPHILTIRGQRVVLDTELARIYGVTTKVFNQAVKRNRRKFPTDFMFQLTMEEYEDLRSQIVTSSQTSKRSQFVTGSQKHRNPKYLPYAFTEHGAVMAANVLRSDRAIQMSVFVVEDRRASYRSSKQSKVKTPVKNSSWESLAEKLIQNLENVPLDALDEAWVKEAEKRFSAWRRGQRKGVSAKQAFRQIRKDLNW